jgi:hypothetical protein
MISKKYKNNLKRLAGLITENVEFEATQGRSEPETLSWYSEEYILNLSERIVNDLDSNISQKGNYNLEISRSSTKISSNTLSTKLNINNLNNSTDKKEFLLTISVNFEQSSNTVVSITIKGVTNKFTMNSKHSASDLENLKNEAVEYFLNSLNLLNK